MVRQDIGLSVFLNSWLWPWKRLVIDLISYVHHWVLQIKFLFILLIILGEVSACVFDMITRHNSANLRHAFLLTEHTCLLIAGLTLLKDGAFLVVQIRINLNGRVLVMVLLRRRKTHLEIDLDNVVVQLICRNCRLILLLFLTICVCTVWLERFQIHILFIIFRHVMIVWLLVLYKLFRIGIGLVNVMCLANFANRTFLSFWLGVHRVDLVEARWIVILFVVYLTLSTSRIGFRI